MRLALAAQVFDPGGHILLDAAGDSSISEVSRRVSRTATLDGGVALNDTGCSAGDRQLDLLLDNLSAAASDTLAYLTRTYPLLTVSLREGCFSGVPQSYRYSQGRGRLVIWIKEQRSA